MAPESKLLDGGQNSYVCPKISGKIKFPLTSSTEPRAGWQSFDFLLSQSYKDWNNFRCKHHLWKNIFRLHWYGKWDIANLCKQLCEWYNSHEFHGCKCVYEHSAVSAHTHCKRSYVIPSSIPPKGIVNDKTVRYQRRVYREHFSDLQYSQYAL